MTRDELAAQIEQLGLDRAAALVAGLLAEVDKYFDDPGLIDEYEAYRDGVEHALNTLLQAGATDPRLVAEQGD